MNSDVVIAILVMLPFAAFAYWFKERLYARLDRPTKQQQKMELDLDRAQLALQTRLLLIDRNILLGSGARGELTASLDDQQFLLSIMPNGNANLRWDTPTLIAGPPSVVLAFEDHQQTGRLALRDAKGVDRATIDRLTALVEPFHGHRFEDVPLARGSIDAFTVTTTAEQLADVVAAVLEPGFELATATNEALPPIEAPPQATPDARGPFR